MIIKELFSRDYIDNCIADMEVIGYEYNGTDNRGRLIFDSKDGNSTQAFPDWEDVRNYLDNGATPFDLDAYLKKDVNECDKLTIKEENSSKADDIDFIMNKYVDNKPVSGSYGSYDRIEIIDNKGKGKYTVSCNGYSVDIDFDLDDDSAKFVYTIDDEPSKYKTNSYQQIVKDIAQYIDYCVRHYGYDDDDLDESQCLTENSLPDWQDTIMIEIRNILENNRIYADIYDDTNFRGDDDAFVLCVEIENGDWKHEHKRADILITDTVNHYDNMEITKIGEETIGDSEDDTYSSIHKFHILRYPDGNGFDFDDIEQLDIKFPTKESKNRSRRNRKRVNEARYSDVVPYENRKYWYFTTHGIGPGTIPRGVKVLDVKEGQNKKGTWGDFICLDAVLNTDELKEFDLIELAPDNVYESNNNNKRVFKVGDKVNSKLTAAANISFNDATIIDIDRNGLCTIECADGTIIDGIRQDILVKSYKKESKSVKESIDLTDYKFKFSTKDGYKVYSKFDKSLNKGLWVAQKEGEEPFEISYEQARGFEPINPTDRIVQHKLKKAVKRESASNKDTKSYGRYMVKFTPYKNMYKFDYIDNYSDASNYCFFDNMGYVNTAYSGISKNLFDKLYDKDMKPNKVYKIYTDGPFGDVLYYEEVPSHWFHL
jgi:hypothetical protein